MNILMVCLGNICRSPLAEGVLRKKLEEKGLDWKVDSCGTSSWHIGEAPDSRSVKNARKNGVDISMLRARQFDLKDFNFFDLILVMDESNYKDILRLAKSQEDKSKVKLILDYSNPGQSREVPDPYFGGETGFQKVFDLLDSACEKLIAHYA